jgi:hypothetical protein
MMRPLVVLLVVLIGTPVLAQPADKADVQQQRRDKIKQRIRALRAYTLTEQLELDEATAAKLFPALAKFDDEFDKLLAQRADLQRRLKDAGSQGDAKASASSVDKLIDEAVANQKAIWDTETKRLEQLRKILTPAQVARTLIVLPRMERRIQNQLRRVVQKNRQGAGPRRGPGAGSGGEAGELGDNPFSKDDDAWDNDSLKDPFGGPRPQPRPPKAKQPCDPFATPHGCR